jgi:hypothetical protein
LLEKDKKEESEGEKKSITVFFSYIRSFTQYRLFCSDNNRNKNENRCNGKRNSVLMCVHKERTKKKEGTKMDHHTAKKSSKKLHAK